MATTRPQGSVRYDNRDRVVIVTGGAGGIGRSICRAYADSGARVVCADVDDSGKNLPAEVESYRCDTSSESDCQRTVERTVETFGGVDVLVNNAAIQPPDSYQPIDTPMVRASLEAQGGAAALANRHPVGRIGKPEEVAAAVLWLTSAEASFITATDLEVDGGLGAFGAFADPYPMPESPDR